MATILPNLGLHVPGDNDIFADDKFWFENLEKLDNAFGNGLANVVMDEYEWTASEGQLTFVLPSGKTYNPTTKWFDVSIGGASVKPSVVQKDSATQFTLLVDASEVPAGISVWARWVNPSTPAIDDARLSAVESDVADIAVNVRSFGAKGDGTTDDTIAIQSCLDYARDNGIGSVLVPDGIYMINGDVRVHLVADVTLHLSKKATLKAIPNSLDRYTVLRINEVDNVKIIGGNIQGERTQHTGSTGEWGYGIEVCGARNIHIEGVTITDCWGDGIVTVLGKTTQRIPEYITIKNNRIDNCRRQGISLIGLNHVIVDGNIITNTNGTAPASGLDIEPDPGMPPVHDIIVVNNIFKDNSGHGVQIFGTDAYLINDVIVSNNTFINNNRGVYILKSKRVLVSNNIVKDNRLEGIYLDYAHNCNIVGNRVYSNTKHGIYFTYSNLNNINGNFVEYNGEHGIAIPNYSEDISIKENYCIGNGQTTDNTYDNIKVYAGSKYCQVIANTCRQGSETKKPARGINTQDGITTGILVINNDCYNGGFTSGIVNSATGTLFGSGNRNKDGTFSATPN